MNYINKNYKALFFISIIILALIISAVFFIFSKYAYQLEKSKFTEQVSVELQKATFKFSELQLEKSQFSDTLKEDNENITTIMKNLNQIIDEKISHPIKISNAIITIIDTKSQKTIYSSIDSLTKKYTNTPISCHFMIPTSNKATNFTCYYYIPELKNLIIGKLQLTFFLISAATLLVLLMFAFLIRRSILGMKETKQKDDFFQNVTHELKTPIATTSIATDIFKRHNYELTNEKTKEYIGIIVEENFKMKQIVDKLLSISIVDQGRSKMLVSNININHMLVETLKNFNFIVQERGGDIITYLDATSATIEGDDSFINMIITNLIDNAIKYSEGAPMISVETTSNSKGIFIKVSDQGIGIPNDALSKIFTKTYRVNSNHNIKGFGLGLYFVKQLVQIHKGKIDVKSTLNKGTEFTVFLPFKQ